MHRTEEKWVDPGRFPANLKSIKFGPWLISYDVNCILPSVCSNKVVCERDDDQFCKFCMYSKELTIPHFPDMVFPNNFLKLEHDSGPLIQFNALDALKCVANSVEAIEVSCAEAWLESRPDASKKKKNFDWTFTTDYKGTLTGNIHIDPTVETIDYEILRQKDNILFYRDVTLFEDELHDHGVSKLSVKIRVMPSCWYVLLRFFLRVDEVWLSAKDTRFFYQANSDYVLRESTEREAKFEELNMPMTELRETENVVPLLPVKEKKTDRLTINPTNWFGQ